MRAQSTLVLTVLLVGGLAAAPALTAQAGRATSPAPAAPTPPPAAPAAPAPPQAAAPSTQSAPLLAARIDLLLSRFQGDKKIASLKLKKTNQGWENRELG